MSKPKIFVLNPYHSEALSLLQQAHEVEAILPGDPASDQSETRITGQDFAMAKKLKVVAKQGTGVDNVDLDAARKYGVAVCNTPAMNAEAVAELTLGLALNVARRITEIDRRLNRGEDLVRSSLLGQSLHQKAIGIVGMGNVGKALAKKWIGAMEGKVIAHDPFTPNGAWDDIEHHRVLDLDILLRSADVISLHVPHTNDTQDMISKREFGLMKKSAILLNCARGGIVDEEALLDALDEGKIWGTALDAMNSEPPSLDVHKVHLANDNLILTPHVGASTSEMQISSGKLAVETVLQVLQGKEVPNRVV
ncbi:Putative D-isomer specific 2-hydroxyacid dehydrogenase, catalytic domain-containing protein [Septoria linicola]|uniref:D-isomer specific 2-hydroxyacid dehydrogenase, catalytic domain-containing protein n=1 Tax=Septoria linicola TaxID=215465 RepID=A0A9Q9B0F7_9PEZI|nr:Putative D-isomer specific 2-hydroxyacid dehydrogenase, catalytic domain-containing protein [Septoria linicola]